MHVSCFAAGLAPAAHAAIAIGIAARVNCLAETCGTVFAVYFAALAPSASTRECQCSVSLPISGRRDPCRTYAVFSAHAARARAATRATPLCVTRNWGWSCTKPKHHQQAADHEYTPVKSAHVLAIVDALKSALGATEGDLFRATPRTSNPFGSGPAPWKLVKNPAKVHNPSGSDLEDEIGRYVVDQLEKKPFPDG